MIFDNEIRNINYLEQLYDQSYIRNDPLIQPVASDVITTNTFLQRVEKIYQQKMISSQVQEGDTNKI